jgi:LPXTG-site transpeptidase (sortase) family protein
MSSQVVVIYDSRWPKMRKMGRLSLLFSFICLIFFLLPLCHKAPVQSIQPDYFQVYLQNKPQTEIQSLNLYIPKLDLTIPVSLEVDMADQAAWSKALETGVAHALGSSLPNQPGTTYIIGHSTDSPWHINQYHAFFFGLKDLEPGDKIILSSQNQVFPYQVIDKRIVAADDLRYINSDQNQLILQTCWPPGTTLKRLLIIAHPETV